MGIHYPYDVSSGARAFSYINEFARDVHDGLGAPQKILPAKYLYDDVGSALFEAITLLPEYGLTRAEERILQARASAIAEALAPVAAVVELGSGSGRKTQRVLEAIAERQTRVDYFAIDVSDSALQNCGEHLGKTRGVRTHALQSSYLDGLETVRKERPAAGSLLLLFLGSSIGNFADSETCGFLNRVRHHLLPGDALLLGTDLVKPPKQLLEAYDDPTGVTSAFNLNVLSRINRELDGDFQLRKFKHEARWNAERSRVEMHLVSLEGQTVNVGGADCRATFEGGESIWTESSQKFTPAKLDQIAGETGFTQCRQWIDREWPFAENLWIAVRDSHS